MADAAGRDEPDAGRATKPPSVVVVAYESGARLLRCLHSLAPERQGRLEVIVVDNGSGAEIDAAARLPFVEVVSPGTNLGYATGSNLGVGVASGEVLIFLNPDTVAAPGALPELAAVLDDESIGVAMARLRLLNRPDRLNSSGNMLHLSGIAWMGEYGAPADVVTEVRDVTYACGAALAIRKERFRELGCFTDELFMYHEDVELGWRARLRGLRVVVVPGADVYHEYEFGRNARKHYFMERNRLVFVLSAYSGRLLLVLAPVLVAAELAVVALAAREGWLGDKVSGWGWCARHLHWLRRHRAETQRLRRVRDLALAGFLSPVIDPGAVEVPRLVRRVNPVMTGYWRLARRAL
jgi:GT2 family glycosyltransferase